MPCHLLLYYYITVFHLFPPVLQCLLSYFQWLMPHSSETETYIMLCLLSPITQRISRLFHWSVTYVGITLLFQQPGGGISFSHTYELCPLNRRPLEPPRLEWEMGPGRFHTAELHQSPGSFGSQRGSSFTGESSRQTAATWMRAIPLRRPSTLGLEKRAYQRPTAKRRRGHPSSAERGGSEPCRQSSTSSPFSCLVLVKLPPGAGQLSLAWKQVETARMTLLKFELNKQIHS